MQKNTESNNKSTKKPKASTKASSTKPPKNQGTQAKKIINKKSIHPNYREITIIMTDGTKFKTRSTYKNDSLKLDIDPKTHPAWTKESSYVNVKDTGVSKFNDRFKGLNFLKPKT